MGGRQFANDNHGFLCWLYGQGADFYHQDNERLVQCFEKCSQQLGICKCALMGVLILRWGRNPPEIPVYEVSIYNAI